MKKQIMLPTITMHRPWCWWVLQGWKTIESRTHNRFKNLLNKSIAIHEGKTIDKNWIVSAEKYLTCGQMMETEEYLREKESGRILCFAYVYAYRVLKTEDSYKALINCEDTKRYGLFLTKILPVLGIKAKGHQGIWYLEEPFYNPTNGEGK